MRDAHQSQCQILLRRERPCGAPARGLIGGDLPACGRHLALAKRGQLQTDSIPIGYAARERRILRRYIEAF
jgi:hypothetical protein